MATRATYEFWTKNKPVICVYHHWDGYPQGAADLLFNSETCEPVKSVEEFLRINPKAEITGGHHVHGDTEYRYDIFFGHGRGSEHRGDQIMAFERRFTKEDLSEAWDEVVTDSLENFIHSHHAAMHSDVKPISSKVIDITHETF